MTWVMRASSEVESSGLVSNTLRITYSCADSAEVLQRVVERGAKALVGESEQVAQIRLRFGITCQWL